jgi:hypothetical protein
MTELTGGTVEKMQMLPYGQVMTISPELAKTMLETSPGNRDIRISRVATYSGAMKRGEWMVAQPLMFDRGGQLRDGHHRLRALIEAGMAIDFLVVTGIQEDAYRVMDVGLTRTMTDLVPHSRKLIEEATLIYQMSIGRHLRPTAHQMQKMCEQEWVRHSHALRDQCSTNRKVFSSTPCRVAAIYWLARADRNEVETQYVLTQYRALLLADFDVMSPQCKAFFRQSSATNFGGGGSARNEMLARSLKAFWYFERDKDSLRLGPRSIKGMIDMFCEDIPRLFNINTEQSK